MSSVLRVSAAYARPLAQLGVERAADVVALGERIEAPTHAGRTSRVGFLQLTPRGPLQHLHAKVYRYAGWRTSKGLVGRGSLFGVAPCVAEYDALAWLRAREVPAVEPVAAASVRTRGRLVAHALVTRVVPRAVDLATALGDPGLGYRQDPVALRALLGAVGRSLAQMHLHGFAHRDCHARNVLVRMDAEPQVWWLDCRRGGPGGRKAREADLAALRGDLVVRMVPPLGVGMWAGLLAAYLGSDGGVGRLDERLRSG